MTFDEASFERARAMAGPDELVVIVPTHRSYFDFLAVPYLFFARPDLGIDIPHIAATEDFARIPVIGTLLRSARVFFIRRGVGTADPELTRRVSELAADGHTLKLSSRAHGAALAGRCRRAAGCSARCNRRASAVLFSQWPSRTTAFRRRPRWRASWPARGRNRIG